MNLREFVTGTPREKDARKTVNELGHHPALNNRQRQRYQVAQPISRGLFLRQMALAGGAAVLSTGAGAALWKISSGTPTPVTSKKDNNYLTPEPTPTTEVKDGKQFVAQSLRELPPSPIKDLINSKVLPFLEGSPP